MNAPAPVARSLGDVLADIQAHRKLCFDEQVPTSVEKLLELHTEALDLAQRDGEGYVRAIERASECFLDLLKRIEALEAGQAKPATKTTKRAG